MNLSLLGEGSPRHSLLLCFGPLQLNLVALNQPHSGDMMGLDTADRLCYEQARAMGLPPNYRAFISSHRQDLAHVVYPGFRETLPITNLRVRGLFCCCCFPISPSLIKIL